MQTQNSKINTVILIVLVLMAGVIIGLLLAGNKTKVSVTTPVQTTAQESVPTTVNTVSETKTEIPVTKNYSNNNFSFDYNNATVKVLSGNTDGPFYEVNAVNSSSNSGYPDYVRFFSGLVPDSANACNSTNVKEFGIKVETVTVNGKTFTTCNTSEGIFYIYTKNGKSVTLTASKSQLQYIDLGSIQIK